MKNFAATIAAQNKSSAAIPAVKSPSIPTDAQIGPQTLFYQTIAITYGQRYPVQIKGDYVYIEGITFDIGAGNTLGGLVGNISIKADTNQTPVYVSETYREIQFPEKFGVLEFSSNYPTGTVYVTFYAGFGRARRDYEPRFLTSSQTNGTGGAGINQALTGQLVFLNATNPSTQRGRITKASVLMESTNAADMTLFLFSRTFSQTSGANFRFVPTGLGPTDYIGQIRFPSFVAGAAGTWSVCDVADLQVDIFSEARDPNGYANGTIYGCLVANSVLAVPPLTSLVINLTIQT